MATTQTDRFSVPLNPVQRATFDELLVVGGERPYAPAGLVEALREKIEAGTADAMRRWTEPSMWLSKAQLFSVLRCEGNHLASRSLEPSGDLHPTVAVGLVAHRAIQLTHTHPGAAVEDVVRSAVRGACTEEKFKAFWETADEATQSDVLVASSSRVMGFLDAWPPLHPDWSPRFEEPLQGKVGRLTLSGRVDLLLGRPRADGRQTMVVADWKSGGIKDEHELEAMFYALLATLRFGVPPFRSVIYSLASGTWTEPDVTAERLHQAADAVVRAVNGIVDTMTETRPPAYTPGAWCSYCPAAATCPALAAAAS